MDAQPLLSLRLSVDYPGKPGVLRDLSLEIGRQRNPWAGRAEWLRQEHAGAGDPETSLFEARPSRGFDSLQWPRPDGLSEREVRSLRGKEIGLILQSPMSSLNPALRIGTQLEEAWKVHRRGSRDECRAALREALENVSLPESRISCDDIRRN